MMRHPVFERDPANDKSIVITTNHDSNSLKMIQWTPEMEQTLLSAIIKFKPVGIHKHFRLVNIIKYLTNNSGVELSLSEILDKIKSFYDLESLEADLIDYEIPESEFS